VKLGIAASRWILAVGTGLLLVSAPVQAQFYTEGYKFHEAVQDKDGDAVVEALSKPGNTLVNHRDLTTGRTALHIVTQRRDTTWLSFLLDHDADPNISDKNGVTPLVLASQLGFIEGMQLLIENGAKVDEANRTGETPLISAVHNRNTEMMRILLKAGADPDRADNSGRTARDYARLSPSKDILLGEIERSAKPKEQREGASTYGPSF
jgi:ankyrin repeat protein